MTDHRPENNIERNNTRDLAGDFRLTSQRRSERGNIFAALFGAVALIGVVGAASTALMRGPLSTVVTVNQNAKADTQMQLAAKLAILEAVADDNGNGNCDNDQYIEPLGPGASLPALVGGGQIPSTIGATKTDPWGTEYGYCAWNMSVGVGCGDPQYAGLLQGPTSDPDIPQAPVIAIVSAGPDRTFQSSCVDYATDPKMALKGGDDVVNTYSYAEARGMSDGLWELKDTDANVATIDKEIELSKAASFLSETNFQGGAKFDSGFLDLSAGGLMKLPTQATSGVCNVANTGVLRIDTSGGGQLLQICDPSADVILDPDGDKWVDIGGSGGAGGNIDGLTDGLRNNATQNLFLGTDDSDLNVDTSTASDNVAVGVGAGKNLTTGAENVLIGSNAGANITTGSGNFIIGAYPAPTATTDSYMNIGGRLYGVGANTGIGVINPQTELDVGSGTVNAGRYQVGSASTNITASGGGDMLLQTNNLQRIVVMADGRVAVGNISPTEKLDVDGNIHAADNVFADFFYGELGSASDAVYSFTGDTNTGLFSPGADNVAIATGGFQRLVVDSSGNVGIGEPTPGQALDVVGNGEFSGYVLGESFRVNSDSGLYEQGTGVSLNVGGAPALTVLASGEVGIGTTNPNMDLEVAGAIRIGDTSNGCGAGTSGSIKYTSSGDALEYCSSDGNWYTIGASGGGGGGIGSPRISALQEAAATNIIDNANYTQTWNWDSLTTENGLRLGSNSVTSGNVLSVVANNTSSDGSAIHARANGSSGSSAIFAEATGTTSYGVEITHTHTVGSAIHATSTGSNAAVFAANAVGKAGVMGQSNYTTGMGFGGWFATYSTNGGYGVYGASVAASGTSYGVYGQANSADSYGGYFMNSADGWGLYTEDDFGLAANSYINWGTINSTVQGETGYGIRDNNGVIEMKNSGGSWSPISNSGSVGGAPGADTQVVYNSGGTLGADANFTWDRTTARMGLGVAGPTGRLQTGDTLYDTAVCPAGYVAGDFDGEGDVQDCVSVGLVVLPNGNVGVGTTTPNLMSAARELSVSTGSASGAVGINLQGNVADGAAVGAIGAWNNSDLVSMIQFPHTGATGSIQFGVHNGTSMDLDAMILQSDGNIVLGDTAADAGLRLDVNGAVGATEYCDEDGLNCIDIADVSGAGGADTEVQFNSGGKLAGSPGFTWTEGSSALNVTGRVNITDRVNIAGQVGSAPQLMRLGDLTDVDTTGAANGDAIIFDGTNWVIGTVASDALSAAGADRQLQYNSNGKFSADANLIWTASNLLGVGSANPQTKLDVAGTVKISYSSEACDASREGSIRYMSNTDTFEVCAATASGWEEIGGNIEQVAGDPPVSNFVEDLNDLGDVVLSGSANGECLTYNGTNWINSACTSSAPSAAGADRQIQFNSNNSFAADANFVYTSAGDFIVGSSQMDDTNTGNEDTRMFFNKGKGAFRAGSVDGDQWDDANVGDMSIALGDRPTASGFSSVAIGAGSMASEAFSVAIGTGAWSAGANGLALGEGAQIGAFADGAAAVGRGAIASGEGSVAFGQWARSGALASATLGTMTTATGQNSMALGTHVIAGDGQYVGGDELNLALNSTVGEGAMAIGLVTSASEVAMSNDYARVTGDQSLGIFMGAQQAVDLQAGNTMGLFGGGMVIDPRQPATNLSADTAFEVEGTIKIAYSGEACDASREGSIRYMSNTDTFEMCAVAANDWEAIGGGVTPGGVDTNVQFNSNGTLDGSSNFTWNEGTTTLDVNGVVSISDRLVLGGTAGNAPTYIALADLSDVDVSGVANGECLAYDGAQWTAAACGGGGGATPGGADTYVQFNSNGALGGTADFTWDQGNTILSISGVVSVGEKIAMGGVAGNLPTYMGLNGLSDVDTTGVANGDALVYDGSEWVPGSAGATPGGANTYVQFNSNGELHGVAGFTWDNATTTLGVTGKINVSDRINITGQAGNAPNEMTIANLGDVALASPANGECLVYDGTNWENATCGGGGGTPAGANTQIQFNNSGAFGASANLTYNGTTLEATSATATTNGLLRAMSTVASGASYAIYGQAASTDGRGIYGLALATSGSTAGVFGQANSDNGSGVYGLNLATTGMANGVFGQSASTSGRGVTGYAAGASGTTSGVWGEAASSTGRGVFGYNPSTSGVGQGVYGQSASTSGSGVYGTNTATSGSTVGVWGNAVSASGFGVYGNNTASGGTGIGGVANTGAGVAVWGSTTSTTAAATGVRGTASGASGATYGVYGSSSSATGYGGYFTNLSTGVALHAQGDITYTGVLTDTSDIRLKTDIQQLDAQDVLARLDQIDTYSFRMRDDVSGQLELGVMAQEVEKVFPELVRTASDEMGTKSVNYTGFVAPLIEATKTLKAENDNLKAELASLKTEQVAMLSSIDDLRADMNGMKAHTGYGIGKAQMGVGLIAGMILMGGMGGIIHLVSRRRRKIN